LDRADHMQGTRFTRVDYSPLHMLHIQSLCRQIQNVFQTREIPKGSTCAKNAQVVADDCRGLTDDAQVALTSMIAESKPDEQETTLKVIVNLINKRN